MPRMRRFHSRLYIRTTGKSGTGMPRLRTLLANRPGTFTKSTPGTGKTPESSGTSGSHPPVQPLKQNTLMVTIILICCKQLSQAISLLLERAFLNLYRLRLNIWLSHGSMAGYRIRKCSGKNRWKVQIHDFADAYLFFRKIASLLNSNVEVHQSVGSVLYTCPFPRTSGLLVLQEKKDTANGIASIKIQQDRLKNWNLKIKLVHSKNRKIQ